MPQELCRQMCNESHMATNLSLDPEQVLALRAALEGEEIVVTTGLVLQELLQGFSGARARKGIIERFAALPLLAPDRTGPDRTGRTTSTPPSCATHAAAQAFRSAPSTPCWRNSAYATT